MTIDLFAGVAVRDFDRAVAWYERLLGAPATFVAHDTEHVWTVVEHGSLAVDLDPSRAGHAVVTLFVGGPDELDAFVAAAADRDVHETSRETYGNGVTKVIFHDPDGNEIGVGGGPGETT
ncbi:VOC family protein [Nocardioides marinquilinus]|uniref:VOC family protein n=1 Tax=Nocardioides marinquilinus TaxID=1210400 RepID=UPI0031E86F33